jgi:hypothetical protein
MARTLVAADVRPHELRSPRSAKIYRAGRVRPGKPKRTTNVLNNAGLVVSFTTPDPGTIGATAQTTFTFYNAALQATNTVNPEGTV